MIEVFGDEGTGKSSLCLTMIANAQALGILCAYGDMEHTLDPIYARAVGVDLSKLYLYQPQSGTQCLQIAETLLKSGLFGLIIIDSVAALTTQAELEGEIGDAHVGEKARLMSQAISSMNTYLSTGSQCTLVFTNQIRDKIGVTFGSSKTTPGGRALKFYASTRIELYRAGILKENDVAYGQKVHATVVKNKLFPPFRHAEFDLVYGRGIDYVADLFDLCCGRGFVEAKSAWYAVENKPLGQGRLNAVEHLRSDRALCYRLYDRLLTAIMAERGFNTDGTPVPGARRAGRPAEHGDDVSASRSGRGPTGGRGCQCLSRRFTRR